MTSEVESVAGTVISIAAEQPVTFDQAGYEDTGMDWTAIGEITDGGEHGREYALVTHMPIASRGVQKFKGSFNPGSKTLQMALDNDDAGQVVLAAALASDNDYSFRVSYQGGDTTYFQAKVMSFKIAAAGVDSIRNASVTLEITANSDSVDFVHVTAA
jgi:hypothetical protein